MCLIVVVDFGAPESSSCHAFNIGPRMTLEKETGIALTTRRRDILVLMEVAKNEVLIVDNKTENHSSHYPRVDVVHFSKNIFSKKIRKIQIGFSKNFEKFRKISKKILPHNFYLLTIVFGSKRPFLRYNMTIDYDWSSFMSQKYYKWPNHNRFS
jgi:hypothetical protein